jgi:hypothetical protein
MLVLAQLVLILATAQPPRAANPMTLSTCPSCLTQASRTCNRALPNKANHPDFQSKIKIPLLATAPTITNEANQAQALSPRPMRPNATKCDIYAKRDFSAAQLNTAQAQKLQSAPIQPIQSTGQLTREQSP